MIIKNQEKIMTGRRQFIKKVAYFISLFGFLVSPLFSMIRWTRAEAKKRILPKGTKRGELIKRNPDHLDTRNLEITPLKDFETMGLTEYQVDTDTWRLEVTGYVGNPSKLSFDQITALPSIERTVLLICPGVFANHGHWKGISIKYLLETVKMEDGITHVTVRGPKGVYEHKVRFPIKDILSDKVFLAYQVNNESLPVKHGFPLRVVAEGYYGFDWVKYVFNIEAEKI